MFLKPFSIKNQFNFMFCIVTHQIKTINSVSETGYKISQGCLLYRDIVSLFSKLFVFQLFVFFSQYIVREIKFSQKIIS